MITPVMARFVGGPLDGEHRVLPEAPAQYHLLTLLRIPGWQGLSIHMLARYRRRGVGTPLGSPDAPGEVYDWDCWTLPDDVVAELTGARELCEASVT